MTSKTASRLGRPTPEQTREKMAAVINAARDAFMQDGYGATRMDEIAKRAEVSKRSLYLWYEDKAALFSAVIADRALEFRLPELSPAQDLRFNLNCYALALLQSLSQDYAFKIGRILGREGWQFPDVDRINAKVFALIADPLHQILRHFGVDSAQVPRMGNFFLAMLLNEHRNRIVSDGAPLSEEEICVEADEAVALFVNGVAASTVRGR